MEYIVKKTDVVNPKIDSPEWEKANVGVITNCTWPGNAPCPETTFKVLYSDKGISVLMNAKEKNLKAEAENCPTPMVCRDSCMEFFFKPTPYDKRYINFEVNPACVMHIGIGSDRYDRVQLADNREMFDIESDPTDGNWTVKFFIPNEFTLRFFEEIYPVCRANFYKCATKPDGHHLGSWAPVETKKSDFHVADFFDKLRFEK